MDWMGMRKLVVPQLAGLKAVAASGCRLELHLNFDVWKMRPQSPGTVVYDATMCCNGCVAQLAHPVSASVPQTVMPVLQSLAPQQHQRLLRHHWCCRVRMIVEGAVLHSPCQLACARGFYKAIQLSGAQCVAQTTKTIPGEEKQEM